MTSPVSIGPRKRPEDLVGILLECHQRIRKFVRLAEQIGRSEELADAEVIDGCRRCERYFTEALPLHVEDEERSLLPRLRGLSRSVDEALDAMRTEHVEHGPELESMLEALRSVAREPGRRPHRERLLAAATKLARQFEQHLALEEQQIFPAVRALLPPEAQSAVLDELRARRR